MFSTKSNTITLTYVVHFRNNSIHFIPFKLRNEPTILGKD